MGFASDFFSLQFYNVNVGLLAQGFLLQSTFNEFSLLAGIFVR